MTRPIPAAVALILAGTLAGTLAACEAQQGPAPSPVTEVETPAFPRWNDGGDAAVLVLEDATRAPLIRLSCPQGRLVVEAPTFHPIASEDRLTVGIGGEAFATVAQLDGVEAGVTSRGAAPEGFYDHVEQAGPLTLNYGAQTLESPQLPVDLAGRFAQACRG